MYQYIHIYIYKLMDVVAEAAGQVSDASMYRDSLVRSPRGVL
jgi:hypothetical protein